MSENLLKCPKCEKKPIVIDILNKAHNVHYYSVRCEHCEKMIEFSNTREEAINTWNSVVNGDVETLIFKRCPICHHAPLVSYNDEYGQEICIVGCPRCANKDLSKAYIVFGTSPEAVQTRWNEYAEGVRE